MRRGWIVTAGLVRLIVFALLLPLATAGTMPAWARLASEPDHVCRCSAEHHDCVCVRCHPDQPDLVVSEESVKGRCGDDDARLTPSRSSFVVAFPAPLFAPAVVVDRVALSVATAPPDWIVSPPTPPPRT